MKLSIIIPVYNEESTIEVLVNKVLDVPVEKEIIIVDDAAQMEQEIFLEKLRKEKMISGLYLNLKIRVRVLLFAGQFLR